MYLIIIQISRLNIVLEDHYKILLTIKFRALKSTKLFKI